MAVFVVLKVVAVVAFQLQGRVTHSMFLDEQRTEAIGHGLRIVHRQPAVDDNVRGHTHGAWADRPKVDVVDAVDTRFSDKHLDDIGYCQSSRHTVEEHTCCRHDEPPRAPEHSSGQQQRCRWINPCRAADCQQHTGNDNDYRASEIGQQMEASGAQ